MSSLCCSSCRMPCTSCIKRSCPSRIRCNRSSFALIMVQESDGWLLLFGVGHRGFLLLVQHGLPADMFRRVNRYATKNAAVRVGELAACLEIQRLVVRA